MHARAAQLIRALELAPHPEGGFFREIHRSDLPVLPADGRTERRALTVIYFLLPRGEHSRWHRVGSDEVWCLCEGGGLELLVAPPDIDHVTRRPLGPAVSSDGPVCTVPAGWWQAARPLDDYALAACTVGPGFEFADFAFLREDAARRAKLAAIDPDAAGLL